MVRRPHHPTTLATTSDAPETLRFGRAGLALTRPRRRRLCTDSAAPGAPATADPGPAHRRVRRRHAHGEEAGAARHGLHRRLHRRAGRHRLRPLVQARPGAGGWIPRMAASATWPIRAFRLVDSCLSARRFVPFGSSICVFRAGGGSRPPLRLGREGSSIRAFRAAYPVVPDASGVRSGTARVIGSRAPNARDWVARARA